MQVLLVWNGPANAGERSILVRREIPLLRELEEQGVRLSVVLFGDVGGLRAELEAAGIEAQLLAPVLPPSPVALARLPAAVFHLRSVIKRFDPDILEGTEPMPAIALGLAARQRRVRGAIVYRRQHAGGRRRLHVGSRLAARLADRVIVSSEAMRRTAAADDRMPLDHIEVAAPGTSEPGSVASDDVAAARRSLGISDSDRVIGVVSRFRWEKGIDVLLRSLDHLSDTAGVHLLIAGTGPDEQGLRQLASRSPLPVHFLGHRDDVELWFVVADVIAIPSRRESFGRVTLEAMAAGRPLVATRVGGLMEAVADGETGLLVPPEDEIALAGALRTLLGDRDLARRYGQAARAAFESRFTIKHMATERRSAWERIMAGVRKR